MGMAAIELLLARAYPHLSALAIGQYTLRMWSRVSAMALVLVVGLTATAGAQADRIEHAQRRVAAAPNDPALWVKLADALVRAQRISEGIDAYQSAIKLDPSAAE